MPRASPKGGSSIFEILKLILNAIGVGAILWWCVASWRLHSINPAASSGEVHVPRVGKGRKKTAPTTVVPVSAEEELGQSNPDAQSGQSSPKVPLGDPFWVFCASQWSHCWCHGDIRWGNEETWHMIPAKPGEAQKIECSIDHLPDVVPGDDLKHCECLITPGTEVYRRTNPMIIHQDEAERLGATLVSSCELFFEARKAQAVDMAQWLAMEGLCSEEEQVRFNRSLRAGPRQLSVETRQHLFRARVDVRFKKIMVTYVAGDPSSPFVKMAEELIKSVHYFSSWPIIVFNFGLVMPESWTPERFPRLVILHSTPLPTEAHLKRSFNFNKLRSILMSKVHTGIQVDVDQFIAPGADILFQLTEKWIHKEYPFPLMPAHFADWSIKDQPNAPWWPRYCPDPEKPCPMQTMRWAHAHPTWTYWALPFFGRWVRRHFRDERLPNVTLRGFQAPGLRVGEIPEDEDMLNVALWEERATQQWCKFDVPATVEFESLLNWKPSDGDRCLHGIGCTNIGGDQRWYVEGVPKVYWTAHHAVDPVQTSKILELIRVKERAGKWPPAIVYDQNFWKSGEELHAKHPELKCLT